MEPAIWQRLPAACCLPPLTRHSPPPPPRPPSPACPARHLVPRLPSRPLPPPRSRPQSPGRRLQEAAFRTPSAADGPPPSPPPPPSSPRPVLPQLRLLVERGGHACTAISGAAGDTLRVCTSSTPCPAEARVAISTFVALLPKSQISAILAVRSGLAPACCARLPSMRGPTARAASVADIVPWAPAVVGRHWLCGGGVGGGASPRLLTRSSAADRAGVEAVLGRPANRGADPRRRGGSPPPGRKAGRNATPGPPVRPPPRVGRLTATDRGGESECRARPP
eukprot:scaffold21907_cov57-Phaeocystis_antarctica.AAC.1